jgi:spermidine/putrescine transport system ATP-binding protein
VTTAAGRPALTVERVTKRFGSVVAVDDVSLEIAEGEFFSLLGPSGCGKTTTLRMMAGFEEPDTGRIRLRGDDVTFVPPNRRNVNLVFQHYELFPHMTVFENVAYGLRLRHVRNPELSERVRAMLQVTRVADLERRGARQLSGGQQQRVALARALVNRPAVLLLDEPLSALDVKLRKQMQLELKAIQADLGTTFVYVTHDQEEALLLSDRIGIMDGGRLLQVGTPRDIYERPADAFVADFVGSLNVVAIDVADVTDRVVRGRPSATEQVTASAASGAVDRGARIRVAVRPERVAVVPSGDGAAPGVATDDTRLEGTIEAVAYVGALSQYVVAVPSVGRVTAQRTNDRPSSDLAAGAAVIVTWPADAAFILPDGTRS